MQKTLQTIQAGRGLAAVCVVLFHLSITMGDARYGGNKVFGDWTFRGNLGVDFFFVLSGFIIMNSHHLDIGRSDRLAHYAYNRFTRLFPIYWLYTAAFCALVALGFGTVTGLPASIADWLSAIFLIRLTELKAPLGVAWTLFHEIAFYGLFAILIFNRAAGIALFALWLVVIAVLFQYPPTDNPTPFQTYFAAYNLDFLIGIGAWYMLRRASAATCIVAGSVGLALLIGTLALEFSGTRPMWTGLAYGIAFGGIMAGLTRWESDRGGASLPILKQLGDASYTLYLIHVPVIGVMLKVAVKLGLVSRLPGAAVYLAVLLGVLLTSYAAHVQVEKRLQRWMKRPHKRDDAGHQSATTYSV